ncbi:MAG: sodium ion-translocating decarboxylase subunit beta [Bacillota bacterium]
MSVTKSWSFGKHIVLTIAVVALIKLISGFFTLREAASIGIIGGADGPTTVFIAGKASGLMLINILYIALFIAMLAMYKPVKLIIGRIFK